MLSTTTSLKHRSAAVDTLRVLAIFVLVIYHHLMIYVPDWGFHYKLVTDWQRLQNVMIITSPWRMGVLWLISGIALRFMVNKGDIGYTLFKRTAQLLFPLLIGILFIVPPQLYIEMSQAGLMSLNYFEFIQALFFEQGEIFKGFTAGIWPSIDVNHLWFLRSLWQFSLVALVISVLLNTHTVNLVLLFLSDYLWLILLVIAACVGVIEYTLTGDNLREAYGAIWFAIGFLFGRYSLFWQKLSDKRLFFLAAAVVSLISVQLGYEFIYKDTSTSTNARVFAEGLYLFNRTIMPLAILAIAYAWFNKPYQITKSLNPFVFPLYIIHQSISIVIAFAVSAFAVKIEPYLHFLFSLTLLVVIIPIILFVIERSSILRICFGMPLKQTISPKIQQIILLCTFVISLPLGFEILF